MAMTSKYEPTVVGSLALSYDDVASEDGAISSYGADMQLYDIQKNLGHKEGAESVTASPDVIKSSTSLIREVIRQTTKEQYDNLLKKRKELIMKGIEGDNLQRREELELQLIEWELDRIEDSHSGEFLDKLEQYASVQEEFSYRLKELNKRWIKRRR